MLGFGKTFRGGYPFQRFQGEITPPILEAPIPEKVAIPLRQGAGEEVFTRVKVGEKVRAGQLIGASETFSSPVHATINGTVKHLVKLEDELGRRVTAVVVEGESTRDMMRVAGHTPEFLRKKPEDIRVLLYRSGVSALGKRGIPTQFKSSSIPLAGAKCVVVAAFHSLPYSLPNAVYLKPKFPQFMTGLLILFHALNNVPVYVAVDEEEEGFVRTLRERAAKFPWLRVAPLHPKYPIEHEAVLLNILFAGMRRRKRRELSQGAVLLEPQDVVQVQEAVVEGKPLIERTVALGGSGYVRSLAIKARIGTMVEALVDGQIKKENDIRVVAGNFLSNPKPSTLAFPVTKSTSNITAIVEPRRQEFLGSIRPGWTRDSYSNTFLLKLFPFFEKWVDTGLNGEPRECISCSYCVEICPVGLAPIHLSRLVARGRVKRAARYRLNACIDCGLCSYVCPSKIPLMTTIQAGKEKLKSSVNKKGGRDA